MLKKLLLLCIITIGPEILPAQSYYPMLDSINHWYYTGNYTPVGPLLSNCNYPDYQADGMNYFTDGDTVLNGLTYKILIQNHQDNPYHCLFGFIREDTASRKIYFQDVLDSPEVLLYNFSMQPGDSMDIHFLFGYNYYYFQSGTYFLDSIKIVNIQAGPRRAFYLNCHSCASSNTLIWIESVGNEGDEIYPYSANAPGSGFFENCSGFPTHYFFQILTCFEHAQKIYFDSCTYQVAISNWCFDFQDSCYYWNICSGINQLEAVSLFSVSPNPADKEAKNFYRIEKTEAA